LRVFLGLIEIAGYYRNLKEGFRELGIEADFYNLQYHPFRYGGNDNRGWPFALLFWLKSWEKHALLRYLFLPLHAFYIRLLRVLLFFYCLIRYDGFIFGFNSTFLNYLDLPILKLFGKKVIYQFNGSDARPPYLDGSIMAKDRGVSLAQCVALTRKKKKIIKKIDRYADAIITIPMIAHFHERPFLNWLKIGIPCKPPSHAFHPSTSENGIRIVHSPSHPEAKGSVLISETIERLRSKGLAIDFVMITNQPNEKVLEALANCDFVVDQLYADYGMPGFAVEAAWFGKPTVIAGYAGDIWQELLTADETPPTCYCKPAELESAIEKMIIDGEIEPAGQAAILV